MRLCVTLHLRTFPNKVAESRGKDLHHFQSNSFCGKNDSTNLCHTCRDENTKNNLDQRGIDNLSNVFKINTTLSNSIKHLKTSCYETVHLHAQVYT